MQLLLFFYLVLTLVVSGFMLADGSIWGGAALLIGSLFGFAGGSGMRGSFYHGQKKSGIVLGTAFAVAGMSLVFFSDVVLGIFGSAISGGLWVLLGFGLGFLAARPEDAGVQAGSEQLEEDVALGVIAPIAAEVVIGRLTLQQADKRIKDSVLIAPEAPALWDSMSAKEREELGLDFMRLAIDPELAAGIEKQLQPLKEADPELWEQALAQARDEFGASRSGGRA